ncbi:hypothetical protein Ga0100230_014425 [Opitutaceae bacterium TAV3]|nr:hypothetical protein Ga0100230_014425 [Opitutaceae bacterium TAV3]
MFLLYRDIASTLRSDQPQARIVLLSNPNASVSMGYFAGLETIGTLYWENQDGLRTAARILTALSAGTPGEVAEAERLVRAHGVTHVVAVAGADFSGAYWMSLRPDEPLPASDQLTSGNAPVCGCVRSRIRCRRNFGSGSSWCRVCMRWILRKRRPRRIIAPGWRR